MGKSILHVGELGNAKLVKNAMAMLAAVQHLSIVEIGCWLRKGGLDEATFQTILKNSQQDFMRDPAHHGNFGEPQVSSRANPGCQRTWASGSIWRGEMEVPMPFVGLA